MAKCDKLQELENRLQNLMIQLTIEKDENERAIARYAKELKRLESSMRDLHIYWQNHEHRLEALNNTVSCRIRSIDYIEKIVTRMENVLSEKIEKSINGPNAWELK